MLPASRNPLAHPTADGLPLAASSPQDASQVASVDANDGTDINGAAASSNARRLPRAATRRKKPPGLPADATVSSDKTTNGCPNCSGPSSSDAIPPRTDATTPAALARASPMSPREQEMMRLILHSLHEMGYAATARCLQHEAALPLEPPTVAQIRKAVIAGNWAAVLRLIPLMDIAPPHAKPQVRFLVLQQKFLELLELGDLRQALAVLRSDISPLRIASGPARIHALSSLLMCSSPNELRSAANWDGAAGRSRLALLDSLHSFISPAMMVPKQRLPHLLDQAAQLQVSQCMYHNVPDATHIPLYTDHVCDRASFPHITTHILEEHSDEVWFLAFSHDGSMLASASKDTRALIWDTSSFSLLHSLDDHCEPIASLAWSPNDALLLTASSDRTLKLWNTRTGSCDNSFERHTEAVTSCAWLSDGRRFVSGSLEKNIYLWDIDGHVLFRWSGVRVMDLAVSVDGCTLIACSEKKIRLYDLAAALASVAERHQEGAGAGVSDRSTDIKTGSNISVDGGSGFSVNTSSSGSSSHHVSNNNTAIIPSASIEEIARSEIAILDEGDSVTGICVASNGKHLLVNLSIQEIHLWDIDTRRLIRKFVGQKQGRFVIHSCFGGAQQNFVLSGSEDAHVYIWRMDGQLIECLEGHAGCVNCVAWNPTRPMFATASDDHTIRIWGPSTRYG